MRKLSLSNLQNPLVAKIH